jgi:hypothetical protein
MYNKIKLEMSASDIVRATKNTKYSPVDILASRYFKENIINIESNYDCIIIWNDEINDYDSYRYCNENIKDIKVFLDEWSDYVEGYIEDFSTNPISFCVKKNK